MSIDIKTDYDASDVFFEDPFDGDIDHTFPPMRYPPLHYHQHHQPQKKLSTRRESSRERARLYKELVGHEPYIPPHRQTALEGAADVFWVTLDIKHYKPEEVTLKVDGQNLVVSGKHHSATESGFDSCEFQRNYVIPDYINMHSLTSNITASGVLCIKATKDIPAEDNLLDDEISLENFSVSLDVGDYKPDEITIRVHGHHLIIRGETKTAKTDSAAGSSGDKKNPKTFARHFSLPVDVDIESVSSRYTKDGKITVEAPRKVGAGIRTLEIKEE